MSDIISKELISEVLGYAVLKYSFNGKMIGINPSQRADKPSSCVVCKEHINIYELMHMVKEWANNYSYYIVSHTQGGGYALPIWDYEKGQADWFDADTEPEAVFQTGQWILEQLEKDK